MKRIAILLLLVASMAHAELTPDTPAREVWTVERLFGLSDMDKVMYLSAVYQGIWVAKVLTDAGKELPDVDDLTLREITGILYLMKHLLALEEMDASNMITLVVIAALAWSESSHESLATWLPGGGE